MASKQAEAKIVISAKDDTSSAIDRIQSKLLGMGGPLAGLREKMGNAFPHANVAKVDGAITSLNNKLSTIGLGMAGVAVGGAAMAKAGFDAVVDTAAKADRISDLGGRLQLNAEQFQVFEKLAKESGASVEEVGGAFMKFRLNLQQASSEGGEKLTKLNKDLAAFGLTAADAKKMAPVDLMKKMGEIMAGSNTEQDQALKLEKVRALFGKTGATLIPVIESMKDYNAVVEKMRASGVLMSDDMAKRGGDAYKSWQKAQNAFSGLKIAFGIEMMPVFEKFSSVLEKRMNSNRKAMMPGVQAMAEQLTTQVEPFLDGMDRMAKSASGMFAVLTKIASFVGWDSVVFGTLTLVSLPFLKAIGAIVWELGVLAYKFLSFAFGPMISGLRSIAALFQLLGFTAAQSWLLVLGPIALIVGAIGLVLANLDEIKTYFGGMIDRIKKAYEATGLFGAAWQAMKEIFMIPINAMIGGLNTVMDLLAKMGIGSGGSFKLIGGAEEAASAARVSESSWGNEGRLGKLSQASITTSKQEVNGTLKVQLDKGLIPADVKSDSKNFNIDALAGGMYGLGA